MLTTISNDLKLYIFSFLDYTKCFQTLVINHNLFLTYMNNISPFKYKKKIINGYFFNDKEKCFYCYNKLNNEYMINMCIKCNINHKFNYDYIKVCDKCIDTHNNHKLNYFKVYTKNEKMKTNILNFFKCKLCDKRCIHLQLSKLNN